MAKEQTTAKSVINQNVDKAKKVANKEIKKLKTETNKAVKKAQALVKKNPEKAALIAAGIGAVIGATLTALIKGRRK